VRLCFQQTQKSATLRWLTSSPAPCSGCRDAPCSAGLRRACARCTCSNAEPCGAERLTPLSLVQLNVRGFFENATSICCVAQLHEWKNLHLLRSDFARAYESSVASGNWDVRRLRLLLASDDSSPTSLLKSPLLASCLLRPAPTFSALPSSPCSSRPSRCSTTRASSSIGTRSSSSCPRTVRPSSSLSRVCKERPVLIVSTCPHPTRRSGLCQGSAASLREPVGHVAPV
jgi:hypothetical protein